jgi:hypothetical protein
VPKTGRNFKLFMSNFLGSGKREKFLSLLPLSTQSATKDYGHGQFDCQESI